MLQVQKLTWATLQLALTALGCGRWPSLLRVEHSKDKHRQDCAGQNSITQLGGISCGASCYAPTSGAIVACVQEATALMASLQGMTMC